MRGPARSASATDGGRRHGGDVAQPGGGSRCHDVELSNGKTVTRDLVEQLIEEEMQSIAEKRGGSLGEGRWDDARATFTEMALADEYPDFLTLPAYERMP